MQQSRICSCVFYQDVWRFQERLRAQECESETGEIFSVSSSGSKVMLTNPDNLEIKRERIDPKSSFPLYESWNRNVVPYMKMSTLSSKHECSNSLPVMALVLVKQAQKGAVCSTVEKKWAWQIQELRERPSDHGSFGEVRRKVIRRSK